MIITHNFLKRLRFFKKGIYFVIQTLSRISPRLESLIWLSITYLTLNPHFALILISNTESIERNKKLLQKIVLKMIQRLQSFDNYRFDQIYELVQVAKACELHENIYSQIAQMNNKPSSNCISQLIDIVDINQHCDSKNTLIAESEFSFRDPDVFDEIVKIEHHTVKVPECALYTVSNVNVLGAYILIKENKLINYEPAAHPSNSFVAGVWNYLVSLPGHTDQAYIHYKFDKKLFLDRAILISGRCTLNYFHWLIEYLPKLWAVKHLDNKSKIPLIVDSQLHPQQIESLKLIAEEFDIFEFDHKTLLNVRQLYVPSISTYHPDRPDLPFWAGSALSKFHIEFLRSQISEKLNISFEASIRSSRKIYLARRGGRSLENSSEIEEYLNKRGFEIIYPEKFSFAEQVKIFNSATIIIGAAGAAFSNVIFCKSDCKIFALVAEHNRTYSMQANLAKSAGAEYKFVTGISDRLNMLTPINRIHASFHVPIRKIEKLIKQFEDV